MLRPISWYQNLLSGPSDLRATNAQAKWLLKQDKTNRKKSNKFQKKKEKKKE